MQFFFFYLLSQCGFVGMYLQHSLEFGLLMIFPGTYGPDIDMIGGRTIAGFKGGFFGHVRLFVFGFDEMTGVAS
jgi:hypothetical protein